MTDSKALKLRDMGDEAFRLQSQVDQFAYYHGLPEKVGKATAQAMHSLVEAKQKLYEAAAELAFRELEDKG